MVALKTVCLRRLGGNLRSEDQSGRLRANPKWTDAEVVEGWSQRTCAVVSGFHVTEIQDNAEVKFPTAAQRHRRPW